MEYRKNQNAYQKKEKRFESKLLDLARVSHTREGGRRMSFRAVMVVGDENGSIGVGVASGSDVSKGIQKATKMAERHMIKIPIVNGTIPHQVEAKYSAARVLLKPQRSKRGLVAGGTVRVMCSLAGIKDISSKVLGTTSNKLNNARAVIRAFKKLRQTGVKLEEDIIEEKEEILEEEEKVVKTVKKVEKKEKTGKKKKIEKKEVKKNKKK